MRRELVPWGWSESYEEEFATLAEEGLHPARVIREQRGVLTLQAGPGELDAVLAGRLRHHEEGADDLPIVGDWVVFRQPDPGGMALVQAVLSRRSKLSRKVAGDRTVEQLVAANVDRVFVVTGLDGDYNVRRIERFLVMVRESGADAVVILNKADLADDPEASREEVATACGDVPVLLLAAKAGELGKIQEYLAPGETAVLVGSSGVGKTTLINQLIESTPQPTGAVREGDDRGKHTTTHRELYRLAGGGLLIDNPGIREIQLWAGEEALEEAFEDIFELASGCRFRDCTHVDEPDCAVVGAVKRGDLTLGRLANYRSLEKEAQALASRLDVRSRRKSAKRLSKLYKSVQAEARRRKNR